MPVYDTTRQQPALVVRIDGAWLTLVRPGRRTWRTHVSAVRVATERERRALRAVRKLVVSQRARELSARLREVNRRSWYGNWG
ncbi:hypothetical protein MMF93_12710 [Streptomyces tubbatahanensis]|uniref:Uncharacterized protein n=1 Tax=Streptomyces tubbatahanensis TaxID=2923272 RepID=A0ABY3XSC7_9ACTN|nr:hypothetical protein [Streptomyces tubbatahanensis]UNS97269.1 hypothetical protein MMF93_12710 [Streptomyces tubbatahanensis]